MKHSPIRFLVIAAGLAVSAAAIARAEVIIDRVAVYNAGNTADTTGYGAVAYDYKIGKCEVTNAQYCEFLNAKAKTDPYALYSTNMSSDPQGGINRSGSDGSYAYSVKSGYANKPVTWVCWYDALRFANWLTNKQDGGDTESGTYKISGAGPNWTVELPSVTQRATWAAGSKTYYLLPSEDEWYKAAYYKGGGTNAGYWLYPTSTNSVPYSDNPASLNYPTNSANYCNWDGVINGYNDGYAVTGSWTFDSSQCYLTDVGTYSQSASPCGTLDQGGSVAEWNETVVYASRRVRGGSWSYNSGHLAASYRVIQLPTYEYSQGGFRVASVPEPGGITLLLAGVAGLLTWRRHGPLIKRGSIPPTRKPLVRA